MQPAAPAARSRLSRADLEAVLNVVRLAYEGLAQQAAWAEMLRQVRGLFRAQDAFLVRTPLEPGATSFIMADGVDPALQTRYSTRFTVPLTNPSIAAVLDLGLDGTFMTSDLVPWQRMEKTEFFQAIRRPRGVRWEICGGRVLASDSRRYLTVNRQASSPRFASREKALMDHLWPHIDRVLKLQDQTARREAEIQLFSGALDTDPDALLFLQAEGGVRALNRHGMNLLSANGRRPREVRNLEELPGPLRAALSEMSGFLSRLGDSTRPSVTMPRDRVVQLSDSRTVRIHADVQFENGVAKGAIVRCQREEPAPKPPQMNFAGWGFTAREEQVVRALLKGSTGEEICDFLGISRDTLKTHVGHLCQKTETRSRTQLVAQLFRGRSA